MSITQTQAKIGREGRREFSHALKKKEGVEGKGKNMVWFYEITES